VAQFSTGVDTETASRQGSLCQRRRSYLHQALTSIIGEHDRTPSEAHHAGAGGLPDHEIERASGGQANADRAADDAPGDRTPDEDLELRQEKLLDEAIEETFPASDPISPMRIAGR
jgi:hypothetical protein